MQQIKRSYTGEQVNTKEIFVLWEEEEWKGGCHLNFLPGEIVSLVDGWCIEHHPFHDGFMDLKFGVFSLMAFFSLITKRRRV